LRWYVTPLRQHVKSGQQSSADLLLYADFYVGTSPQ